VLTGDALASLLTAVTFAIVGASFLSGGGATVDGPWSRRIVAALTAFAIASSGLVAFLAFT